MRRTGSVSVFWNTSIYQIPCDEFPRTSSLSSFLFGLSVSAGPCDEFPRTSSLILSLLVDARCSVGVTASRDDDV